MSNADQQMNSSSRLCCGGNLPSGLGFMATMILIASSVLIGGCDTGSRNVVDNTGPPPISSDFPQLASISPSQGSPGDEITLTGTNFSSNIEENLVTFSNNSNSVNLAGLVTAVNVGAFDPETGAPSTLTVVVPGGVRTGNVSLNVLNSIYGDPPQQVPNTFAGARGFTAAPELIGWAVNDDGNGTLSRDSAGNVFPDFVYLYGYNLANAITDVQIYDGTTTLSADSIIAGPPPTASYSLPPGIEMVGVEVPSGLIPGGDSAPLRMTAINGSTGGIPLTSSGIDVPWRFLFGPGDPSDLPAYIAGAVLPQGIRRGDIEITCNMIADPPNAIWTLIPEYLADPLDPDSWTPCVLADGGSQGVGLLPSGSIALSTVGSIVGPGEKFTFVWDTLAQIPDVRTVTRIRLAPGDPDPPIAVQDPPGEWYSGWLVINNEVTAEGAVSEDFSSNDNQDFSEGNAEWNSIGFEGTLAFSAIQALPALTWGTGTIPVVLESGKIYELNTDVGTIYDISDDQNPENVLPINPGAPEFWVSTFHLEEGANFVLVGSNPITIRCAGNPGGDPDEIVCELSGDLALDGEDGTVGATDAPGIGGAPGFGGGPGGDGGSLELDAQSPVISAIFPATPGGFNGGEAGGSVTWVKANSISTPKAGCGGGGGGAAGGFPGETTYSAPTYQTGQFGAGGVPFGDDSVMILRGGGGGGGGGACATRVQATAGLAVKHGGGGGGGGGAIEVVANGSIMITGSISANGGAGKKGTTGTNAGAGGGGAGGTLVFRASGNVELGSTINLRAAGGLGASATTSTSQIQKGGDGADGRIRVEANGDIRSPGEADFTGTVPSMSVGSNGTSFGLATVASINSGDGSDGPLNLTGASGVYTVDTDLGTINDGAVDILVAGSGTGEFNLSSINLPAEVTLLAVGSNPLILRIDGPADIAGTIDASGFDGGIPDLTDPLNPVYASGGAPGAGGGAGGDGGFATSAVEVVRGGEGGKPAGIPDSLIDDGTGCGDNCPTAPQECISLAKGGFSANDDPGTCHAGSGGGGGYTFPGGNGASAICVSDGAGGSDFGAPSTFLVVGLDCDPVELLAGGCGGAGGGGFNDSVGAGGQSPGSAGGGAGGMVQISAKSQLVLYSTCQIFAVGGSSFQGPLSAGNGGGGAGGAVRIQGRSRIEVEAGAVIDVSGGLANLDPGAAATYTINGLVSAGGDGSSGVVRVETPLGFSDGGLAISPALSSGLFIEAGMAVSYGASQPYPLTASDGITRVLPVEFDSPGFNMFSGDPGSVVILYEGAPSSLSSPGSPGEFIGPVGDPALLGDVEFMRVAWFMFADPLDPSMPPLPAIDDFTLPFNSP